MQYFIWTGYKRRLQLTTADYLGKKKTPEGDAFSAAAANRGLNA